VAGFDAGADDYITKPVKPKVLMSKVKSFYLDDLSPMFLKRIFYKIGGIVINRDEYKISSDGVEMTLPRKEFELLSFTHFRT